jgi:hypothetical protein
MAPGVAGTGRVGPRQNLRSGQDPKPQRQFAKRLEQGTVWKEEVHPADETVTIVEDVTVETLTGKLSQLMVNGQMSLQHAGMVVKRYHRTVIRSAFQLN